ncbi:MAG: TolC family protein [Sulfurimonas sp.]|jgi:outer membrane protein TolC|nr:TolC family protein [Sulfurimonas sp.]MDD3834109.1 TolC family protein [Sulfurimonas sp.]MDY0195999.1 TolC family protein [Sulfurovaceae bacterium]
MKSKLFGFIFALLFSLNAFAVINSLPSVNIAVLSDGKSASSEVIEELLKEELSILTKGEFIINFPLSVQLNGNYSTQLIQKHFNDLQENSEVDFVVTIGVDSSQIASQSIKLNKPTFAPFIFDMTHAQAKSENFNYLKIDSAFDEELKTFKEITEFTNLALVIDENLYALFPEAINHAKLFAAKADVVLTFVRIKSEHDAVLEMIPSETEAIMITQLPLLKRSAKEELIKGLIIKQLPSYSLSYEFSPVDGILASSYSEKDISKRVRRLALNMHSVLRGESANRQPTNFREKHELTINMQTAGAIGVYPNFQLLRHAKLLYEDRDDTTPLTLSRVAEEAILNNLNIIAGQLSLKASEENIAEVRSILYPQIRANLGYTQVNSNNAYVKSGFNAQKTTFGSIALEQILFSQKALANLEIQKKLQIAQEAQQKALELEVVKQATTVFLNVLVAQTYKNIAQYNLSLTQTNLDLANSRVNSGASDLSDVYYWESQITRVRQNLLSAQSSLLKAKDLLKRILHRPMTESIATQPIDLKDLNRLIPYQTLLNEISNEKNYEYVTQFFVNEGLELAPELNMIDAQLGAQKRQLRSDNHSYWVPDVILQGEVSRVFDEERNQLLGVSLENENNWQVGVIVSLPLFEGGAKNARKSRSSLKLQQLGVEKEMQRELTKERIRSDMHDIKASYPSIQLSKQAARAAKKSFEIIRQNYAKGTHSMTVLLTSQLSMISSEQASASAIYKFMIDFIELQHDIGSYDFFFDSDGYDQLIKRLELALKNNKE